MDENIKLSLYSGVSSNFNKSLFIPGRISLIEDTGELLVDISETSRVSVKDPTKASNEILDLLEIKSF